MTDHAMHHKRKSVHHSNGHSGSSHQTMSNRIAAIQDSAAGAIDGAAKQLISLKDKGIQASQAMQSAVVENPKTSLALAFGVGYILARLRRWL